MLLSVSWHTCEIGDPSRTRLWLILGIFPLFCCSGDRVNGIWRFVVERKKRKTWIITTIGILVFKFLFVLLIKVYISFTTVSTYVRLSRVLDMSGTPFYLFIIKKLHKLHCLAVHPIHTKWEKHLFNIIFVILLNLI